VQEGLQRSEVVRFLISPLDAKERNPPPLIAAPRIPAQIPALRPASDAGFLVVLPLLPSRKRENSHSPSTARRQHAAVAVNRHHPRLVIQPTPLRAQLTPPFSANEYFMLHVDEGETSDGVF